MAAAARHLNTHTTLVQAACPRPALRAGLQPGSQTPVIFVFFSASIQSVEKNVDFALERLFLEVNTKQTSAAGLRPTEPASVFHLKVTSAPAGVKSRGLLMGRRPLLGTLAANV